jgi:hypothetical protein
VNVHTETTHPFFILPFVLSIHHPEEEECLLLEANTKQRLVKTVKIKRIL